MAKFNYKPNEQQEEKPQKRSELHGRCEVYGCNRAGHIFTSNWNCRYHYGKNADSLARITLILNNHYADFDWHERLLTATPTDFALGNIAKRAPNTLEVHQDETFTQYKERMQLHINQLLNGHEVRIPHIAPMLDRKSMAGGIDNE